MVNDILVVGGSGYLGSNFAEKFKKENPTSKVAIYDQIYPTNKGLMKLIDNFYSGDINDKQIEDIIHKDKYDTIINFAALRAYPVQRKLGGSIDYDFLKSTPLNRTNVQGVKNL